MTTLLNPYFGEFGGMYVPQILMPALRQLEEAFVSAQKDPEFQAQFTDLLKNYAGRPTALTKCQNITQGTNTTLYLKREDLLHGGAHKTNQVLGQALLAKRMGKTEIIAETGAGQHGVALATAAALVGLECEIHMGVVDIAKEHPNVSRMKILGCTLVPVSEGAGTLKEAVDSAFGAYLQDPVNTMFAIGSVVGPSPFPEMVAYFQSIVGCEAHTQFKKLTGGLPNEVVACVGGGSNAIGLFSGFLDEASVRIVGIEPAGEGLDTGHHAATLTLGKPGHLQGFYCYFLQNEDGSPAAVHSIASGLDYPGVGPVHCHLKDLGRVHYETATDQETLDAFMTLSREEGIIPALESSHAVAYAIRRARELGASGQGQSILVNLSGRGDKDIDFVIEKLGL